MAFKKLTVGNNAPDFVNVVIEIPMHESNVKYEINKDIGLPVVDRFLKVSMCYPCNYGYIPCTKGGDGDELDVLVIADFPIHIGSLIVCRPVGMLVMEDESGNDEKIIAVPIDKIDKNFSKIKDIEDVEQEVKNKISHFFENYKKLDKDKWVKVSNWLDKKNAKKLINDSLQF